MSIYFTMLSALKGCDGAPWKDAMEPPRVSRDGTGQEMFVMTDEWDEPPWIPVGLRADRRGGGEPMSAGSLSASPESGQAQIPRFHNFWGQKNVFSEMGGVFPESL